jgi:amidase
MNHYVRRDGSPTHCRFDPAISAAVTVRPGDAVRIETVNAFARLPPPDSPEFDAAVSRLDLADGNPLSGPIAVEGAQPGDTIVVRIDAIAVDSAVGLSPVLAEVGVLKERIAPPHVGRFPIAGGAVELPGGLRSALRPSLGVIGSTPSQPALSVHAGRHGGNLDDPRLAPGARVYLPVLVPGGGIALGDVHGVQGDGEWRAPIEVDATVDLHIERVIAGTQRDAPWTETAEHWIAYGMEGSIWASLEGAAHRMVDFLADCCDITPADALLALSCVGDLRLCSVPGAVYSAVVRAEMPKAADPAGRLRFR